MAENKSTELSPLRKLEQQIEQASNVRGAIMLAQDRWAKNYQLVTGKKDGAQRFEAELLNYLDIVAEKPELQKAEKFSHFAAVMKAAVTGLSFRSDGHLYPIAIGGKVKVQIGAHGKREMLNMMSDIKFVNEAQLVMRGDHFIHDKINNRVKEHWSTDKSSTKMTLDDITHAYCRLEWKDGRIVDVVLTNEELRKAKSKSKNQGPNSVWEEWAGEMCKKTCYHRAKKLYHRLPDGVLDFGGETSSGDGEDEEMPYRPAEVVDESTGEITPTEEAKPEPKKKAEAKQESFL